jgi:hypothetical protein
MLVVTVAFGIVYGWVFGVLILDFLVKWNFGFGRAKF